MALRHDDTFKKVERYLVVDRPNAKGWWDAVCPFHDDVKRSAGFNFDTGVWSCRAGCGSGSILDLVARLDAADEAGEAAPGNGFDPAEIADIIDMSSRRKTRERPAPSQAMLADYARILQESPDRLLPFCDYRGLTPETLERFQIGWNPDWVTKDDVGELVFGAYTIPVYDKDGRLLNVRLYRLPSEEAETKIWSWGSPELDATTLYLEQVLAENDTVVLTEGEWDALITNQMGIPAVTGTTGAGQWQDKWNHKFTDKTVYICYDRDNTGERAARHVHAKLREVARAVYIVVLEDLPFTEKHGEDLTDYFTKLGKTTEDFKALLEKYTPLEPETSLEPIEVSVRESYNPALAGKPMAMTVTVVGRSWTDHLIPRVVEYTCNMNAGTTCKGCPMAESNGHMEVEIKGDNPVILQIRDAKDDQVNEILRRAIGAHKCGVMTTTRKEQMNVELLNVRTSINYGREEDVADFRSRAVVNVGKYKTEANQTVRMIGTIYPSPRDQTSVFQSWRLDPVETALDAYELSDRDVKLMKLFQTDEGETPLRKMSMIARDLSANVTRILDRPIVHIGMDLVWHSVIAFDFDDQPIEKGWLDALFVGDARTGKSEIAERLRQHYGVGLMISCESASIPGILGAVKPMPGGKGWALEWGAIPLNDRRLVILDEAGGLSPDQISQLSSVRSSGVAEVVKVEREVTRARTRLCWLSNPRDNIKGMNRYLYGVRAIGPLIGNQEDIARFDFAMSLFSDEVSMERINAPRREPVRHVYTDEACHTLLKWVWSRRRDQVVWEPATVPAVYDASLRLAKEYVPDPPLIQGANVRTKIARLAVSIAARTFSTDKTHELLVVKPIHVEEAVRFLDRIYDSPSFGYKEVSRRAIAEERAAIEGQDEAYEYIKSYPGLSRFLFACGGQFRRQQIEEMLNKSREEANAIIQRLVSLHMIKSSSDWDYLIQPQLNIIIRDRIKE